MFHRLNKYVAFAFFWLVSFSALPLFAVPPVPTGLMDVGVDTAGTATAIGTALGGIVATTITIFGAFLVVRYGLMWIRKTVK